VSLPRKVRVAVIGVEGHTNIVFRALPSLPDVSVVAYASAGESNGKDFAGLRWYRNAGAMLDREKPDVAVVATDDGARAAAILDCAKRRIHVFSEKPVARTRAEYDLVKKAISQSGVRLGLMLEKRFAPHFLALRDAVRTGGIGEVAHIQGQKSYKAGPKSAWKNARETYSGTIPWVGIHMADLMLFTSGRTFVECASFEGRVGWPQLGARANTASILFRLDNGGTAVLSLDYLRPGGAPTHDDDRIRIAGTKGVAEYQSATGAVVTTADAAPRKLALPPAGENFADFLESVYNGRTGLLPIEEIWTANEVVLAANEAVNTGRVVRLGAG
jgi:predicted dehydrogenase